jgi:uncharacterized UBP type Zn finger protein
LDADVAEVQHCVFLQCIIQLSFVNCLCTDEQILQKKDTSSNPAADSPINEIGEGKYTLMAIISHMGKNTEHGHYIAHVRKNGEWVLFNDEKVTIALLCLLFVDNLI